MCLLHASLCMLQTQPRLCEYISPVNTDIWAKQEVAGDWTSVTGFSWNNSERREGRVRVGVVKRPNEPFRSRWWWPHVHLHALGGPDWDPQWAPQGTPCLRDNHSEGFFSKQFSNQSKTRQCVIKRGVQHCVQNGFVWHTVTGLTDELE